MQEIIVSVVVPVYNSEKYLEQCLDSISNQTLKEIEIICVDDGSTDNSLEILKRYSSTDSRYKVIQKEHKEGTGAGAARNVGLQHATGKYIIFLDSDDFFENSMLEKGYEQIKKANAQMVLFGSWKYDDLTGKENEDISCYDYFPTKEVFSGREVSDTLFQLTWGTTWNVLLERCFVCGQGIQFQETRYTDDMLFVYMAMAEAERITILKIPFVHYRTNSGGSQSANRFEYMETMYRAPLAIKEELVRRNLFETYRITYFNRVLRHIIEFISEQKGFAQYAECYNTFREILAEKLRLTEFLEISKEKIYYVEYYKKFEKIMKYTLQEYLFYQYKWNETIKDCFSDAELFIRKDIKVIIYGAGDYGRRIYGKIWESQSCRIVAWLDKNYEKLGYPVQNPKDIQSLSYDYILICIADKNTVAEVRRNLVKQGVKRERILNLTI